MKGWEGDEVGFVVRFERVEGVPDLFDLDRARKGCFLGIVALKLEKAYVSEIRLMGCERST